MFKKFAAFWIKNQKLTIVIITIILLSGIFSWFVIPKQYNPKIDAPAFNIIVPAPGYSSKEVLELIVKPLENKIGEINGVDDIYGYSQNDMGSVMVAFKVGEKKEDATIRLYNKIYSSLNQKPYGVQDPIIQNIDPEELPIYTFGLYSIDTGIDKIHLRKTALDLIDGLKDVDNVRGFFLNGGEKETISILVDINKAESRHIPLVQIIDIIKKNNIGLPGGTIRFGNIAGSISFDGQFRDIEEVRNLVVGNYNGKIVRLKEISKIVFSVPEELHSTWLRTSNMGKNIQKNVVFVGIAKKDGTNAVYVVNDIKKRLEILKQELPSNYKLVEIQNLGQKAKNATNMLLVNLIQSIIIVLFVLTLVLGFKNAINVAISIPLTLSVVFLYSLIIGDNINRITLFALILVLGMLVDDATVVVENINRKLNELKNIKGEEDCSVSSKNFICVKKRQLNAIFEAIGEVELGVILSTVTRLLAFGAMFFVTGMMGSYMGPIPKYAIVAMITSTAVALSINPFLTDLFYNLFGNNKKTSKKDFLDNTKYKKVDKFANFLSFIKNNLFIFQKNIKKRLFLLNSKFDELGNSFEKFYYSFMNYFFDENKKYRLKRFKIFFWIFLGFIVVIPPAILIFKMRMLPKSNQNQIYIRIDLPQDSSYKFTKNISDKFESFLIKSYGINSEEESLFNGGNNIIKSISTWNAIAPMPDFANIFRRSMARVGEKYISMRINLIDKNFRDISSEEFVILIRDKLNNYIHNLVPDSTLRILEEPPGPPTQATFMIKVQGESNDDYSNIEQLASWIDEKLQPMFKQQKVVDVDNSISTYQTKYVIKFDHTRASNLGINADLVAGTIRSIFYGVPVSVYHSPKNKEGVSLYVTIPDIQKNTKQIFENITIPTSKGGFVSLSEVADILQTDNEHPIYSDNKIQSVYIFGEMGDNSVIYPGIMTFRLLLDDIFREGKYKVLSWNPYGISIKDNLTGKRYKIMLGGERELTMDTFRDLGIAMIIAFIAIYFVMVGQFKSFGTGGVIMLSFLFGFFGVFPLFTILYLLTNEYFSATSMIGVIALAGIVVGNAILLLEYIVILVKQQKVLLKDAIIKSGFVRMKPIVVTSLTTIFGATTILGDPVWSGLAYAIIGGLISSAILTPMILPLFLYDSLKNNKELFEE